MRTTLTTLTTICLLLALTPASAQPATLPAEPPSPAGPSTQPLSDKLSVTEHSLKLGQRIIDYQATAGYMPVKDEAGKERANFFFVAYEEKRPAPADPRTRPITFIFNGGPGAAAVWLHLGTAGPQRIAMKNPQGDIPIPPYQLVENQGTWLADTDLVFIDPVGTGYSRPAQGEKPEAFFGVKEDIAWMADFIRLYLTRYERWLSPKFLAGESYGSTRAAGLSEYLVDRFGISLNGIILISVVLDFQTLQPGVSNDLPYVLFLPAYTATAWHHRKLAADLQADLEKTLREVEKFAIEEYLPALAQGDRLSPERRTVIIQRLARYTALPEASIHKSNLRLSSSEVRKTLLENQRLLLGRFDSRITGHDPAPAASRPDYDPSFTGYLAAYAATFNDYVRRHLRYESDLPYEILTDRVQPWNFGRGGAGYLSVSNDLRSAMIKTPHLKVLFASGYFDLATPYFGADYTVNHLDLGPDLRKNLSQTYYMGGHMMYHTHAALMKLQQDVSQFIHSSLPRERLEE